MKNAGQIEYWDKASAVKEFTTNLDYEMISGFIGLESEIVDYGCGYGRTLSQLYSLGYKNLTGFDFSPAMIERGKSEYPYLNLNVSINNKINCQSETVDLVLLFAVLTCIKDNGKQLELIKEILRVLKPGGLVYINDFLLNTDPRNIERYKNYLERYNTYGVFELPEGAILRHHDENYINELTDEFKSVIYKNVIFPTMNGNTSNGFIFVGSKL